MAGKQHTVANSWKDNIYKSFFCRILDVDNNNMTLIFIRKLEELRLICCIYLWILICVFFFESWMLIIIIFQHSIPHQRSNHVYGRGTNHQFTYLLTFFLMIGWVLFFFFYFTVCCSRSLTPFVADLNKLPKWNYDGWSTVQPSGEDNKVIVWCVFVFYKRDNIVVYLHFSILCHLVN